MKHLLHFNVEGNAFFECIVLCDKASATIRNLSQKYWACSGVILYRPVRRYSKASQLLEKLCLLCSLIARITYWFQGSKCLHHWGTELQNAWDIDMKLRWNVCNSCEMGRFCFMIMIAHVIMQKLHWLKWETFEYLPDSPYLSPCDISHL